MKSMSQKQLYPYTLQLLQNPMNIFQSYPSEAQKNFV